MTLPDSYVLRRTSTYRLRHTLHFDHSKYYLLHLGPLRLPDPFLDSLCRIGLQSVEDILSEALSDSLWSQTELCFDISVAEDRFNNLHSKREIS